MAMQTQQEFFVVVLGNGRYRIFSVLPVGQPLPISESWTARGTTPVCVPIGELTSLEVNQFKTDLNVKHGCTVVNQRL